MNIELVLEFNKIKEIWKELTVTESAKEKIDNHTFILDEIILKKELKDTGDAKELIEKCGTPPLSSIDEAKEVLMLAKKDQCLTPYQLERVARALTSVRRIKDYLNGGKKYDNSLAYYELNLNSLDELCEEITNSISCDMVSDYASKQLLNVRREIVDTEDKMKQKAEQIIHSNKDCMADNFITMRNGRVCVPVKKDCKWKIPGSTIDKSSTGNTLFIEPIGVANLFDELQNLKIDEENEVHRILYTLTAMLLSEDEALEENIRVIEKLDYIFSKGKLSIDMDAVCPEINLERKIELINARHPLMDKTLCIPLQFELGNDVNGVIITGPNTGGKTVCIKTVALNCLMAQCGLFVTCSKANICMNSSFLCDIGDGQNITENLSTFSAHIKNVMDIVEKLDQDSLVIMDELGSGTDPTEGMGIAIAILEELRKSGCLFLVTTHYPEVKEYAARTKNVINARMEFDKETLKPTYKLIIGEAGESCAFHIAKRLGMPESMLNTARQAAYHCVSSIIDSNADDDMYMKKATKIKKEKKNTKSSNLTNKFNIGDSVRIFPDKKIGIVCSPVNEQGDLQVQLPKGKIWINHKRVELIVASCQLYPDDYDFSIIFDTVEQRKKRHDMSRKYTEETLSYTEE